MHPEQACLHNPASRDCRYGSEAGLGISVCPCLSGELRRASEILLSVRYHPTNVVLSMLTCLPTFFTFSILSYEARNLASWSLACTIAQQKWAGASKVWIVVTRQQGSMGLRDSNPQSDFTHPWRNRPLKTPSLTLVFSLCMSLDNAPNLCLPESRS